MFEWGGIPLYDASRWDDLVDKCFLEKGIEMEYGKDTPYGVLCFLDCIPQFIEMKRQVSRGIRGSSPKEDRHYGIAMLRETSAHWAVYGGYGKTGDRSDVFRFGVRIDFNKEWLDVWAKKEKRNGMDVIWGKVHYVTAQEMLDGMRKQRFENMALRKRNAYKWENERRLIILNQKNVKPEARENGAKAYIKIDDWNAAIRRIVFSPYIKPCNLPDRIPSDDCVFVFVMKCLQCYCENRKKNWGRQCSDQWRKTAERFIQDAHRSGVLDLQQLLTNVCEVYNDGCMFDFSNSPELRCRLL